MRHFTPATDIQGSAQTQNSEPADIDSDEISAVFLLVVDTSRYKRTEHKAEKLSLAVWWICGGQRLSSLLRDVTPHRWSKLATYSCQGRNGNRK